MTGLSAAMGVNEEGSTGCLQAPSTLGAHSAMAAGGWRCVVLRVRLW